MKLRDYQEKAVNDIYQALNNNRKVVFQLATGGGKTFIFCYIASNFVGNTLILVNRRELVSQTKETINKLGGSADVQMVETFNNKIKRGEVNLNNYDLLIIDECHRLEFIKVVDKMPETCKVLGFTATPVIDKVEYFEEKGEKYRRKKGLINYYDKLVVGTSIKDLINRGMLVDVKNYAEKKKGLKIGQNGDYTKGSINSEYRTNASIDAVYSNYINISKGLKTMIFNPNTTVNKLVFERFKKEGVNCRMYDSVNNDADREDLVNWFKNTPDAVLINVSVFTTGFDVRDVQTIIMNRATTSLSLYLQIVGRGARITDKIHKPFFNFIDLGNNIEKLGRWNADRDWQAIFSKDEVKKCKDIEDYWICEGCEYFNLRGVTICEGCGEERHKKLIAASCTDVKAELIDEVKLPNVRGLIDFCLRNGLDLAYCRREYRKAIARMFIDKGTKAETVQKTMENGILRAKIMRFAVNDYFLIQKSGLDGNIRRSLETFIDNIEKEILKIF